MSNSPDLDNVEFTNPNQPVGTEPPAGNKHTHWYVAVLVALVLAAVVVLGILRAMESTPEQAESVDTVVPSDEEVANEVVVPPLVAEPDGAEMQADTVMSEEEQQAIFEAMEADANESFLYEDGSYAPTYHEAVADHDAIFEAMEADANESFVYDDEEVPLEPVEPAPESDESADTESTDAQSFDDTEAVLDETPDDTDISVE